MHGMIRRYRVRLGTVEQAAHYAEKGFIPILRDIPGFVSCHLLDAGNDILTCVALFETEQGAEAAVRASREWFRDEWSSFRPVPPEVTIGEVLARAPGDPRAAGPPRAPAARRRPYAAARRPRSCAPAPPSRCARTFRPYNRCRAPAPQ